MSSLIDLLRSYEFDRSARHWQPSHFIKHPEEMYNTLYFPHNNVDIRLCAKNGCSSLKYVWFVLSGRSDREIRKRAMAGWKIRRLEYEKYLAADEIDLTSHHFQFRKGSRRVAIKRDPIERALSAIKYLYEHFYFQHKFDEENKLTLLPTPTIEDIIDTIDKMHTLDDTHFFTQHYYMGYPEDYDIILPVSKLDSFIDNLIAKRDPNLNINTKWLLTSELKTAHVRKNVSKASFTVDDLPENTKDRLYDLYRLDYKLGWCL